LRSAIICREGSKRKETRRKLSYIGISQFDPYVEIFPKQNYSLPDPGNLDVHRKFFSKNCHPLQTLIDGTGKTISDAAIIVEGTRIVSIERKQHPKGVTSLILEATLCCPG